MRRALCLLAIWLAAGAAALAAEPTDDFEAIQAELQKARLSERALAEKSDRLEIEQRNLSRQLVKLASVLQHTEKELTIAEEKLAILNHTLDEKNVALKGQREQLSAMMSASIRLSQMPPEAAVMMPGDPSRIIEAARAVEMMANSIHTQSTALSSQMQELVQIKEKVEASRRELQDVQVKLQADRKKMNERLKERAELSARNEEEYARQKKRTQELARKSETMQALVDKLEQEKKAQDEIKARAALEAKQQDEAEARSAEKAKSRRSLRSFSQNKGEIRLPVAGRLFKRYGDVGERGDKRKGIVLQAREGARVTAPFDGEVVFTGPFLNYGKIVILRHSNDFHTLLAGLASIQSRVGDMLMEGEPLGVMGNNNESTRLYMELRKANQPVNPESWIKGMAQE